MQRIKTTLQDLSGESHAYECTPFAFDECFDLGLELAAVIGGPIGGALKSMIMGSDLDDATFDDQVLGDLSASFAELPANLLRRGGSTIVARILANTERIGSDDKGRVVQRLRDADDRTAAYAAGNLREAVDAVRWVLTVHYGPFLMGLWDALRPQLSGLASLQGMLRGPQESNETESNEPTNESLKPTEIES